MNLRDVLLRLRSLDALDEALAAFSPQEVAALLALWDVQGRDDQFPPIRAQGGRPWSLWLMIGGRGAGKTRAGAEWVKGMALGRPPFAASPVARIALVAETASDLREVMVEGVSGILAVHSNSDRPLWQPSRKRLQWANGVVAQGFSAEDPESLRGPQFAAAWCDELAKWKHPDMTFDMLQFGLRLGERPRQMITTTPRPIALLRKLMNDPRAAITRARTQANSAHLSPDFLDSIVSLYAGTRLGRQELDGEIVDDMPGALWTRDLLEQCRETEAPPLSRIVVAVDPPASSSRRADCCGLVAAGLDRDGIVHVLADATLARARPAEWAAAAVALWRRLEADALVAEVNQGGEMVAAVIAEADAKVPVEMVRATRGKYLRAAPVAQLYEQNRVRHAGAFPELEDEMCSFAAQGAAKSPDRLDALVWAVTSLALGPKAPAPRMRRL